MTSQKNRQLVATFFIFFISACGGSSTPEPSLPALVLQNKAGIWVGNIGSSSVTAIIDEEQNIYLYSENKSLQPKLYNTYLGNLGEHSIYSGKIVNHVLYADYFNDNNSPSPTSNSTDDGAGGTSNDFYKSEDVQIEVVYRDSMVGTLIDGQSLSLGYSSSNSATDINSIGGTWFYSHHYKSGTLNGTELISRFGIDFQVDSNGDITGNRVENEGWNWTPTFVESSEISGTIEPIVLGGHTVLEVNLVFTFTEETGEQHSKLYHGYGIQDNSGANSQLLIILKNDEGGLPWLMNMQNS